jgi:hypothetical protein
MILLAEIGPPHCGDRCEKDFFLFIAPLFLLYMTRTVSLFKYYVHEQGLDEGDVFASCILAMERGQLHVDATNQYGLTTGAVHFVDHYYFHSIFWHKYWALGPDVATFWSGIRGYADTKDILKNTPALWSDLAIVQRFAAKNSWLESEVHERIRASLRFAWMAAVVLL